MGLNKSGKRFAILVHHFNSDFYPALEIKKIIEEDEETITVQSAREGPYYTSKFQKGTYELYEFPSEKEALFDAINRIITEKNPLILNL